LGDWGVVEASGVEVGISSSELDLRSGVSVGRIEIDTKDFVGDEALVDHGIEHWGDAISGDGGISKSENAIHGLAGEEVGELSGGSESVRCDGGVSEGDGVLNEVSDHVSSSVLDGDWLSVSYRGRRGTGVV